MVFQPTVQSLFTWSLEYDRSLGRLNTIASPLVDPSFHSRVVDADSKSSADHDYGDETFVENEDTDMVSLTERDEGYEGL